MKLKFGVPCSKLEDKIKDVELHCTTEEQAFGLAAGCVLAGKKPEVYIQNSGLCRAMDILTSLYLPYEIPFPKLLLSLRKSPYHHSFIGRMTRNLLMMVGYKNVEIIEQDEF